MLLGLIAVIVNMFTKKSWFLHAQQYQILLETINDGTCEETMAWGYYGGAIFCDKVMFTISPDGIVLTKPLENTCAVGCPGMIPGAKLFDAVISIGGRLAFGAAIADGVMTAFVALVPQQVPI